MDKKSTLAKWFKNTGFTLNLSLYLLALLIFISFSANVFSSSIKELKNQQITEILFNIHTYPIAPSAPSKSNEPKRVNLGGGERRTTTK